ncbi:uncharacterized protein LOC105395628 [Plutella xylostella]|uniref:uncharacterized protein LOC105395628 n=1 Tax=Plutella xylostella TaxID=51655 RepID=UPI002032558B|nr:uncharacterized protein LOC105395628 [Plutella xylostella]
MTQLTVLLLFLSVVKCYGMSKSELEEFSDFLKRSSALDQNLKGGFHSSDEHEEVSDNAWEESGKFEGDLILNERQRRLIVEDVAEGLARNGLKDSTKRWPNNEVIYYIQREHFTSGQVQAIMDGIEDLARSSCVKFKPYKKGDRDAVVIQGSRRGCFSQVGYQGGYQVLNLSARHPVGRGCFRHGTVVHEMLHTLGFYHMQSSPDRDEFIDVLWENIVQPARHNFRKYNVFSVSDFGVGYDYDSVLHYSRRAFSSNGKPTLVPKQSGAHIGQRIGLSDKDTQKLNKMYCDADSNTFDQPNDHPKVVKKRKPKNQPFQGHGIGYHQGKTVVIKLPAAETFKYPIKPTYPTYDYFKKGPEDTIDIISSPKDATTDVFKKYNYDEKKPLYKYKTNKNTGNATVEVSKDPADDNREKNSKETEQNKEIIKSNEETTESDSTEYNDKAIERLDMIVRSHVYPSSAGKSHGGKIDYSKYYNPIKTHESERHSKKIDELFSNSKHPVQNKYTNSLNDKKDEIEKLPLNNASSHEEWVHQPGEPNDQEKYKYDEIDSTFRTSQPFKKHQVEKYLKTRYKIPSEFIVKYKDIKNKHDYSSYYDPDSDKALNADSKSSRSPYTLLGESVPLSEPWYKVEEIKPNFQFSTGKVSSELDSFREDSATEKDPSPYSNLPYLEKDPEKEKLKTEYGYYSDPDSLAYLAKKQDFSQYYHGPKPIKSEKPAPFTKEWYKTHENGDHDDELRKKEYAPKYTSPSSSYKSSKEINKSSEGDDDESREINHSDSSEDKSDAKLHYSAEYDEEKSGSQEDPYREKLYDTSREKLYDFRKDSYKEGVVKPMKTKETTYDVTEESDESEEDSDQDQKKIPQSNGKDVEGNDAFDYRKMEDRLKDIMKSYLY